jgi:hypothetical protein
LGWPVAIGMLAHAVRWGALKAGAGVATGALVACLLAGGILAPVARRWRKEGLPRDSTPDLGAGGPRFKSGRPDQNISPILFSLLNASFTQNSSVEFRQTGGLNSQVV